MTRSRAGILGPLLLGVFPLLVAACGGSPETGGTGVKPAISGRLEAGLRVLTIDPGAEGQRFTVYRGDYVRPELSTGEPFTLEIPALEVSRRFPAAPDESPYFKVPDAGTFEFRLGAVNGVIEAVEYTAAQYREVGSEEAVALISNVRPFILDVRTGREFAAGHIEGATLIPVQELHTRLGELADHKREPVLVYCATGNRSTVAAKLLIDAGFVQVVNLRRGIAEWTQKGLPTVR